MKTLKVRQNIETLLDFPVSWQQCYSCFEELPTGGSTMEERNTTAQQQCKMAAQLSTCTRKEQRILGKAIPLQAWTGPEGSRRLRLPDFKTIGT
jgi:hypothetical protein